MAEYKLSYTGAEINEKLRKIDNLVGYTIPNYWQSELDEAVDKIKQLQDAGGQNCFSFVVMTDMHYPNNLAKRTPVLARYVMDKINAKYALCLGDVFTRGVQWDKEGAENHYVEIEQMLEPIRDRLLQTQGNHDGTYGYEDYDGDGVYDSYLYNYTPQEMFERIYRKVGMNVEAHFDPAGSNAYYVDDVSNRVRFIMLNTHCTSWELDENGIAKYNNMRTFRYTQAQYDFMRNEALILPDKHWRVIVASHVPVNQSGEMPEGDIMEGFLNAYKNKAEYNGVFAGTGESNNTVSTPNFTDLCDESSSDFLASKRIDSSAQQVDANELYCITNYIPCKFNKTTPDVLRIKGWKLDNPDDIRITLYNSNKVLLGNGGWHSYASYPNDFSISDDGVFSWNVGNMGNYMSSSTYGTAAYARISCCRQSADTDLIITVNEEIAYTETEDNSGTPYDAVDIDVNFANAKGNLIGYFGGHVHKDTSADVGFPIITTRCDGKNENQTDLLNERVEGTTTEQSFDVFTVDTNKRIIYRTKIGAGSDGVIRYSESNSGSSYTNVISTSIDANGNIYNGVGYANNMRVSSSGVEQTSEGTQVTGFIPFVNGDIMRGSVGIFNADALNYERICVYDENKNFIYCYHASSGGAITVNSNGSFVFDPAYAGSESEGCAFVRVVGTGINESAVITINEKIV
jgi:hypothetical protein